jgi:hypothetical protein
VPSRSTDGAGRHRHGDARLDPKIMEAAGIDLLPPEAGVPTIRRELTRSSTRGEIVVPVAWA